jgi:hypothetical protein
MSFFTISKMDFYKQLTRFFGVLKSSQVRRSHGAHAKKQEPRKKEEKVGESEKTFGKSVGVNAGVSGLCSRL